MTPFLLLLALPLSGPAPCSPDVSAALERLDHSLKKLGQELPDVSQAAVQKRLQRRLRDARRAAEHVRAEACAPLASAAATGAAAADPAASVATGAVREPMGTPTFRALIAGLRGEADADSKLEMLEARLTGECVSVRQAQRALALLRYDPDKLRAATLLLPRLSNRARAYELVKTVGPARQPRMGTLIDEVTPVPECGR